jgi:hypothetical protein
MALLVSTRLAALILDQLPPERAGEHLPALFPSTEHIQRLNRTPADARALILDAERHFTYMAIPFVLAVYSTFIVDAIELLRDAGIDTGTNDPNLLTLEKLHGYLEGIGLSVPKRERELFDFIRLVRNRIVHYGGTEGSALRSSFVGMSSESKGLWRYLSDGDPPLGTPKEELRLEARHLIPALAVTNHLGEVIDVELSQLIPKGVWADVAVKDFMSDSRPAPQAQRLRKLVGYSRYHFGALGLDEATLGDALDRYLAQGG